MSHGSSLPGAATARRFNVAGLDCQNEVRALKAAVGPVVGGEQWLSFDAKAGRMNVDARASADTSAIISAVATTGMKAEPAPIEAETDAPSCASCATDAPPAPPLTPAGDAVVFKIHGMDCADEVATLKRELARVVGEERLSFDLIHGLMFVSNNAGAPPIARIEQAVARTGMSAELWAQGEATDKSSAEGRRRATQAALTALSGVLAAAGFTLHAVSVGDLAAVFAETPGATALPPPAAILAYSGAVLCALRYVAPKALLAARRLRPDMNLLMTIAVIGAIGIGQWFEAATVSFLFAVALALEAWSLGRARRAVAALMELAPTTASVIDANGERQVSAGDVVVGARIVVRPGERLPLDGKVVEGESQVNQAPITGESMPVSVAPGAQVFAGTINGEGALEIETTKAAQDTTLARIVRMVGSAHGRRAPVEQWVEKFARIYTPVVLALALAVFLIPPLFGGAWGDWFYRALVLLVIACPCALVISTPVSIVAGLAGAAKQGVLIKGGVHLETPATLTAIAMDKTGTLTEGRPRVVEVNALGGRGADAVLALAAALEARSEHPLAKAILAAAAERNIAFTPAADVKAIAGKGVVGMVEGREAWAGSLRFAKERISAGAAKELKTAAATTAVAVGEGGEVWGLIAIADAVRPEAVGVVRALHAAGVKRVVMLTGDNQETAERIGAQTGVDDVRAGLLPEQKVAAIEDLVARGERVAMVGDGVNDAPAMARANLGVAMGAIGSDAAIETADIALMQDDLSRLPWLIRHSKATIAIIRQNIGFSVLVKVVFVVLTLAGAASLWAAIAADVGASLLVVLNGLRLLNREQRDVSAGTARAATSDQLSPEETGR